MSATLTLVLWKAFHYISALIHYFFYLFFKEDGNLSFLGKALSSSIGINYISSIYSAFFYFFKRRLIAHKTPWLMHFQCSCFRKLPQKIQFYFPQIAWLHEITKGIFMFFERRSNTWIFMQLSLHFCKYKSVIYEIEFVVVEVDFIISPHNFS